MKNSMANTQRADDEISEHKVDVLVVDDEEGTLSVLSAMLQNSGYQVYTAANGKEACKKLQDSPPRVVITDWKMPEMNGIELCRWIRSHFFPWYIHIIVLTGQHGGSNTVEALNAGADEFLNKPISLAELRARMRTIERMLELESREAAIIALANLAESRDTETGGHLYRIKKYTQLLIRHLNAIEDNGITLSPTQTELFSQTSVLHDIGKVGIPDHILLKPGLLNDEEFRVMQKHTTIGADALNNVTERFPGADFYRAARDIILTHHERFDGTGYPHGLQGEDIPLCGRIMALVDVYDALTTKRVYKDAMPHDEARSIIVDGRGTQFDPRVVDAFVRGEDDFKDNLMHQTTESNHD